MKAISQFVSLIKNKVAVKNFVWLFSAEFISKGVMFILAIILARYLGAENFGKFNFSLSYTVIFSILADFGLSTLLIREVSKREDGYEEYLRHLLVIKIFVSILSFIVIVTSVSFIHVTEEIRALVWIVALYTIANSFNDFLRAIFRSFQNMHHEAFSKLFQSFSLFFLILLIIFHKAGLSGVAITYSFVSLATIIFNLPFILLKTRKIFLINLNVHTLKDIFQKSWPFAVSSFFVLIYMKIDTVMLGFMKTNVEVGIYSALYNFIYSVAFIPDIVVDAIYPLMSGFYHTRDLVALKKFYINSFKIFSLMGFVLVIVLCLFSKDIITIVFGKEFVSGAGALKVLSLAIFVSFVAHANLVLMNSVNMERKYLYSTIAAALLNVFLNWLLIPKYSMLGAAWATLIAETVGFIYCSRVILNRYQYEFPEGSHINS